MKGVFHLQRLLQWCVTDNAPVGQHRHARGHCREGVEVVRDEHHGQPKLLPEGEDQAHEARTAVRVQPRCRLVEQQFRLQRQRTGQCGPLDHAARQLRRHQQGVLRLHLDHRQLEGDQRIELVGTRDPEFLQRESDILADGQCGEQRALLEQDAVAALARDALVNRALVDPFAEEPQLAGLRPRQPDDVAQQRGLAATRAADQRDDLAAFDIEVEPVVHKVPSEARDHAAQRDDGLGVFMPLAHPGIPIERVAIANTASARITTVIAATTEAVVWTTDSRYSAARAGRSGRRSRRSAARRPRPWPGRYTRWRWVRRRAMR